MQVVYDDEAVRRVPRLVRSGTSVAILADQAAIGLASSWVPFLGRPAKTPRGPAVFALRLQAPVVYGTAVRLPSGRYHASFEPLEVPLTGDRETDTELIMHGYTAVLERWVRQFPEQYFWHHRRWKHQPPYTLANVGTTE
jgi:KDO2-lipid IV(A) lauroyltransferase